MNLIKFNSRHPNNINAKEYRPIPVKDYMPEWYRKKDKFKKEKDGKYRLMFKNINGNIEIGRVVTWKSCPALLDVFISGYYLLTPCDIEIKNNNGEIEIVLPKEWQQAKPWLYKSYDNPDFEIKHGGFCALRGYEKDFPTPEGYEEIHFRWFTNWTAQVPEGYTTLYTHPLNLDYLPFKTISGFIDSSNELVGPGNVPFFLKKGWTGIIPAGTPYVQIIPIKNESWQSEIIDFSMEEIKNIFEIKESNEKSTKENKYKKDYWLKKNYK